MLSAWKHKIQIKKTPGVFTVHQKTFLQCIKRHFYSAPRTIFTVHQQTFLQCTKRRFYSAHHHIPHWPKLSKQYLLVCCLISKFDRKNQMFRVFYSVPRHIYSAPRDVFTVHIHIPHWPKLSKHYLLVCCLISKFDRMKRAFSSTATI
jgi:hypothetical protein